MPTRKEVVKFVSCCSILLLVIVVFFLSIVPFRTITIKEIDGIKFHRRSVGETTENVTLSISSTYNDYLFEWWKSDNFSCSLSTSDIEEVDWLWVSNAPINSEKLYGHKWIEVCCRYNTESRKISRDGRMIFNDDLSEIIIMVGDKNIEVEYPNDLEYDEIFYVFPAEDIDEAIDLANEWTFYRIEKK